MLSGFALCADAPQLEGRSGRANGEEIDLRFTPEGCTAHPVVKLGELVPSLARKGVEAVRVYFKENEVPLEAMKLFLSKYGYAVEEVTRLSDGSLMVFAKRRSPTRAPGAAAPRA